MGKETLAGMLTNVFAMEVATLILRKPLKSMSWIPTRSRRATGTVERDHVWAVTRPVRSVRGVWD